MRIIARLGVLLAALIVLAPVFAVCLGTLVSIEPDFETAPHVLITVEGDDGIPGRSEYTPPGTSFCLDDLDDLVDDYDLIHIYVDDEAAPNSANACSSRSCGGTGGVCDAGPMVGDDDLACEDHGGVADYEEIDGGSNADGKKCKCECADGTTFYTCF